jgi:hypothetical protein
VIPGRGGDTSRGFSEECGSKRQYKNELAKVGVFGWRGREVRIRKRKGERDVGMSDVGCMLASLAHRPLQPRPLAALPEQQTITTSILTMYNDTTITSFYKMEQKL